MIGLIFAMEDEIKALKKIVANISTFHSGFFKYFIFQVNNNEYVATFSGIGKANASACVIDMVKTFSIKKILNIGSCGSCDMNLNVFDVVLVEKNYYLDVDATAFGYEYGQVPKEKPFYEANNIFSDEIEKMLNKNNIIYKKKNCGTADSFISLNNYKKIDKTLLKKVSCIDMESTAIAQICHKNDVSYCFLKVISDSLFTSNKSNDEFKTNMKKVSNICTNLLETFLFKNK